MILAVTGGRDFGDVAMVDRNLRKWINPYDRCSVIIEGGARGADRAARHWARDNSIHVATVEALWDTYSKPAGHFRNEAIMLLKPELLLAFPGGRGTANAVETARRYGIKIRMAE